MTNQEQDGGGEKVVSDAGSDDRQGKLSEAQ